MINSAQLTAITQLAHNVLTACYMTAPINAADVVTRLGGRLLPLTGDYDARIHNLGERAFSIEIDRLYPFPIAVEIGHLFLHMGYMINPEKWARITSYTDSPYYRHGYSQEDHEARKFASALTMPEEEFRSAFNCESVHGLRHAILRTAEFFRVPEREARIRGKALGLVPWEYE